MNSAEMQAEWEPALNRLGWYAATPEFWERLMSHPPQAAILAPALDTVPSIQGNAVYVLIERLAECLPFSCLVLARELKGQVPDSCPISDRILYYRGSMRAGVWENALPHRTKKFLFGTSAPSSLSYARNAGKALRILGVDLIVIEDVPNFCPVIRAAHSGDPIVILHQHCNAIISLPKHHWKCIEQSLNALVFVAEQTRYTAEAKHGKLNAASDIIYNGVDLNHYDSARYKEQAQAIRKKFGIGTQETVLLFVGRLIPAKGALEIAQAFARIQTPGMHLLLVGDDLVLHDSSADYLEQIKTLSQRESQRIHLAGVIQQSLLPAYYAAANVVALPSLGSEGLPKVVTEALAMGTPVLASKRGGIWELLREGDNGWLLTDPTDIDGTSQQISRILQEQTRLDTMRQTIIERDRPLMDERHMIGEFTALLQRFGLKNLSC